MSVGVAKKAKDEKKREVPKTPPAVRLNLPHPVMPVPLVLMLVILVVVQMVAPMQLQRMPAQKRRQHVPLPVPNEEQKKQVINLHVQHRLSYV